MRRPQSIQLIGLSLIQIDARLEDRDLGVKMSLGGLSSLIWWALYTPKRFN